MIIDIRCRLTIPEVGSCSVTIAKNAGTYDRTEAYANGTLGARSIDYANLVHLEQVAENLPPKSLRILAENLA